MRAKQRPDETPEGRTARLLASVRSTHPAEHAVIVKRMERENRAPDENEARIKRLRAAYADQLRK